MPVDPSPSEVVPCCVRGTRRLVPPTLGVQSTSCSGPSGTVSSGCALALGRQSSVSGRVLWAGVGGH